MNNFLHPFSKRKILISLITFLNASFLLPVAQVFASDGSESLLNYFHIRQETLSSNGVLVSRPQTEDKLILDLVANNQIRSLEDYAQWLQNNIKYQKDVGRDIWFTPQETLTQKCGDCEDFAFLNSAVIRVLGYEPHFLAMFAGKGAHAVCVFKKNGNFVWIDNMRVKNTNISSLKELARHFISVYHYSRILELDLQTRQWQTLYQGT